MLLVKSDAGKHGFGQRPAPDSARPEVRPFNWKRKNLMRWQESSTVHGGCRVLFHKNTCVLYLRLATHSFVFMGEEDDETLSLSVLSRKAFLTD